MQRTIALCAGTMFAAILMAQDFRASILGQITDPSKAPIPGATVRLIKEGSNTPVEATTNTEGFYTVPFLEPGTYTLTVAANGFASQRRNNLQLRVADKLQFSFAMVVGSLTETVTVTGDQELIETANASRGLVFDPLKVTEYPLNGRQSYMLMALTPGVMFTQRTFGNTGFSGTRGWDVNASYTMNGGRTGTNQFLLNGSPISSNDGSWNIAPNVEAIQEFKVMVNTYDSQYGRSGGGHVNTTIKSGTNQWHGSLFDYWRNYILDANTTQNNRQGAGRGFRNLHQFGGTVGGAIRKDKDLVFFSFEGWQERVPFPTVNSTVPAGMRAGDGFTQFGQRVFDPLTAVPCRSTVNPAGPVCSDAQGLFVRQPFAGNVLPASRISPIAREILKFYPNPNALGAPTFRQNYFRTDNIGRYRYEQPMARYDKIMGDKDRAYVLFSWQDGSEFRNQNGFEPPAQTGNMLSRRSTTVITADWTRVLSPSKVLDIRASYNPFTQNFPDVSDYDFTYDKVGIKKLPAIASFPTRLMPRVTVDQFEGIFGNQFVNETSRKQINFTAGLNHTVGRHSMKYGTELAMQLRGTISSGRPTGDLAFDQYWTRQFTGRGSGFPDGSSVATFLLGLPTGGSVAWNDTFYRRDPYAAWYFQDDWKVNSKLTLNLGLRYDIQFSMYEINNRINTGFAFNTKNPLSDPIVANWRKQKADWDVRNPSTPYPNPPSEILGGLLFAGVNGQPRKLYNNDYSNIQPRIGAAYNFLPKTVLRAGIGVFYRAANQGGLTTGFSQSTGYVRSLDGGITPSGGLTGPYSLEDPYPNGAFAPTGASQGLLTNTARGVSIDGRERRIPRTMQWSFGLERELGWGTVLEVSYVGSRSNFESRTSEIGDMPTENFDRAAVDGNFASFLNQRLPNPFQGVAPAGTTLGDSTEITRSQFLRSYPLFPGITFNTNPWGKVWYHGLQMKFEKRAFTDRRAGALTWVVSYTLSKQMENGFLDNRLYQKGKAGFITQVTDIDRLHSFSFSGVWDIPVGAKRGLRVQNKALNAIVGDWNYDWILTYSSGPPTPWPDARFNCASYKAEVQSPSQWFNNTRGCYTQRPAFTFREVGSRFPWVRDPSRPQLNMAVVKRFYLGERVSFELRGEAFNATNTPILRGPNTSFTDPLFGTLPIQQDNFARNIQIGARIRF